jgi:syntaxin 16
MATRDLSAKYKKLRFGFYKNTNNTALPNQYLQGGEQPFWVDMVKSIETQVKDTEELIEKLHEAHKNRLMVRFDDETDGARDREIDKLTAEITKSMHYAKNQLDQIGKGSGNGGDEDAVCKNIQKTIALRLQTLSMNFRKSQKQYLERLKLQKSGKSPIFLDENDDDEESKPGGSGIVLSEGDLLVLEENQVNLKERDKEIQKIADSIGELATIFRELAVLVIEQGTILDRIDYNMDMVVDSTKHAVDELEKTVVIQKQARPQKCIFILVIINFILLVILTYKHS